MFLKNQIIMGLTIIGLTLLLNACKSNASTKIPQNIYTEAVVHYKLCGKENQKRNFDVADKACEKGLKLLDGYEDRLKVGLYQLSADVKMWKKDYASAEALAQQGIFLSEELDGKNSAFYGTALLRKARVYNRQNKFSLATPLFSEASTILKKNVMEGNDKSFANEYIQSLQGQFFSLIGENKEKEAYDAAAKLLKAKGVSNPNDFDLNMAIASGSAQIGDAYYTSEEFDKAQPYYEKAINLYYKNAGSAKGDIQGAKYFVLPYPSIISAMNHLGEIYIKNGRVEEGEKLKKEAKTATSLRNQQP